MHNIAIIGHFGFGGVYLDGQTIKTKVVAEELCNKYGRNDVSLHDTHGGIRFLIKLPFVVIKMMMSSHNIIMMPAHKGLLFISPALILFNIIFRRSLYYVVIGGWLPKTIAGNKWLCFLLKRFNGIFVETRSMYDKMADMGFTNVSVMPNFKPLEIADRKDIHVQSDKPFALCTFSRVVREKGIEDAIEAVKTCNARVGHTVFTLDIYGQIGKDQKEWFDNIMKGQPDFIRYKGCVDFGNSVSVLKHYFALLFPTYYEGECFAGTLIDAFAAGVPVIASDWHDNPNIIDNGKTGRIFHTHNVEELTSILYEASANPESIIQMRSNCLDEAMKYQPERVIEILVERLRPIMSSDRQKQMKQ